MEHFPQKYINISYSLKLLLMTATLKRHFGFQGVLINLIFLWRSSTVDQQPWS